MHCPACGHEKVDRLRAALGRLFEMADDLAIRVDDIVALRADACLVRMTNVGTERASGGAFERPFLWLGVFGTDGLVTRIEQFDLGHEAEALARFDEFANSSASPLGKGRREEGSRRAVRFEELRRNTP